jgi:hypothetical protein
MVDLEHYFDGHAHDREYAYRCCKAAIDGSAVVLVGERRTSGMLEILPDIEILPDARNGMLEILPDIEILPDARNVTVCRNTTKDKRDRFAEPTKQEQVPRVQNAIIPLDRRSPVKMVSGRAWSPGIYQSLRLLGKSL